jgi:hypothetical protein
MHTFVNLPVSFKISGYWIILHIYNMFSLFRLLCNPETKYINIIISYLVIDTYDNFVILSRCCLPIYPLVIIQNVLVILTGTVLKCLLQKYSTLSFIDVPYNLAVKYQCLLWKIHDSSNQQIEKLAYVSYDSWIVINMIGVSPHVSVALRVSGGFFIDEVWWWHDLDMVQKYIHICASWGMFHDLNILSQPHSDYFYHQALVQSGPIKSDNICEHTQSWWKCEA